MAISRMQQPRQQYGLGSLVKKAVRGVKKIVKSPLGKAAILGGLGMIPFGAAGAKASLFSRLGGALGTGGKLSSLGNLFKVGGKSTGALSIPRMLMGGLGATAIAAPFLMGGGDEEEEDVEVMDIGGIRNRVKDFYRTGANAGEFSFLPQKQFVQPKVETQYRHKKTGQIFKERKDWEARGFKNEDMAQDVKVIMPPLDLLSKTK